ncbi:hypothetical protein TNCV_122961 [Trichonephila clavipes]|nr:hypothetical protein TNCV_122961 [Trichonephila clavipes]
MFSKRACAVVAFLRSRLSAQLQKETSELLWFSLSKSVVQCVASVREQQSWVEEVVRKLDLFSFRPFLSPLFSTQNTKLLFSTDSDWSFP